MRGSLVTCEANDGRDDFEKRLVVNRQMIDEALRNCFSLEDKITWTEADKEIYQNECAIMLIDEDSAKEATLEEIDDGNKHLWAIMIYD